MGYRVVFDAQRFSSGDRLYVRQLMDEYAAVVRRACAAYARSPDHAEDLWQETWLLVLLKGHTYRGRGSFRGWLARIARNACISEQRAVRSRSTASDWTPDELRDSAPGPLRRLERIEARASVARALARLTRREREVVELRVLEGLSTADVAARLDLSPATVRSHLRHAMAHLRAILTEDGLSARRGSRPSSSVWNGGPHPRSEGRSAQAP